ncbi:MAG: D-amino acid aminotransferase [Magnetovibrio sp.]|nr:D-amino acid aminotransferase [Magnetovibrio sp.]
MARIAYVNGRYLPHRQAMVHIEDRGYQFADGVYEVIAIHKGRFLGEKGHMDRLEHSLNELSITAPLARKPMMHILREVVRKNRVYHGLVYMQITRGVAARDHPFPAKCVSSMVVTAVKRPPIDKKQLLAGISVISTPDLRWKRRDIKSISLLPNVLGKQKAIDEGSQEAWLFDEDGYVTEGTATNAWIVTKESELITRDISENILNGITRLAIIEAAKEKNIPVIERRFTIAEARKAREAFISSSNAHVKAVTCIDNEIIGEGQAGELTVRLLDIYMDFIEKVGGPQYAGKWN